MGEVRHRMMVGIVLAVLILLSALSVRWFVVLATQPPEVSRSIVVDRVQIVPPPSFAVGETLAPAGVPARWITLPHQWSRGGERKTLWYVFDIDLEVPPNRLWALYSGSAVHNARIYLNGEIVGAMGPFEPRLSRFLFRPLYLPLANGLVRPGLNRFFIELVAYPAEQGRLEPIHLGPDTTLRPVAERQIFLRQDLVWFFVSGALAMALVVAVVAWYRPRDPVYRWLAAQISCWSAQALLYLVTTPILPVPWMLVLSHLSATWFCACSFMFVLRFIELRKPGLEALILGSAGLGSVVLLGAAAMSADLAFRLGPVPTIVQMVYGPVVVYLLIRCYLETRRLEYFMVLYSGLVIMLLGAPGIGVAIGEATVASSLYLFYATPLVLATVALVLVYRFVLALRESESVSRSLDAMVRAKTRELAENHRRLRALEREQVLARERERIMRDMHDGVGGHLVASLAGLQRLGVDDDRVRDSLEKALTDLRLMIDSLDEVDGDLNVALGMLRTRLEPQLTAAGVKVVWRMQELPLMPELKADGMLQLLRILQEAVSNVIRHSGASSITLEAGVTEEGVRLCLTDDGRGFDTESSRQGRGMRHMQQRAERIGAMLILESSARGTRVTVLLDRPPASTTGQA